MNRSVRALGFVAFAMGLGLSLLGVSSFAQEAASEVPQGLAAAPDYLVAPGDLLVVYILDVPELSREYRVSSSGAITLPLLPKPLNVARLSLNDVAAHITDELRSRQLVTNAHVTVTVKESRAHSVAVTGAVKKPQLLFVAGKTTVLELLSEAEGLREDAGDVVHVVRGPFTLQNSSASAPVDPITTLDLGRLMQGDLKLNIDVYPGDRVIVPTAGVVYVVGAVNKPGGFLLTTNRRQLTVMQALALAEDLKPTAMANHASIVRGKDDSSGKTEQVDIDLKQVLAGHATDATLHANDILFIPDSSAKKAFRRGVEAALQAATGVLIYRP